MADTPESLSAVELERRLEALWLDITCKTQALENLEGSAKVELLEEISSLKIQVLEIETRLKEFKNVQLDSDSHFRAGAFSGFGNPHTPEFKSEKVDEKFDLINMTKEDLEYASSEVHNKMRMLSRDIRKSQSMNDKCAMQAQWAELNEEFGALQNAILNKAKANKIKLAVIEGDFNYAYDTLKKNVSTIRDNLKVVRPDSSYESYLCQIRQSKDDINRAFEYYRSLHIPNNAMRRKVDSSTQMCQDLEDILNVCLNSDIHDAERKKLLRQPLGKDYARSVFGPSDLWSGVSKSRQSDASCASISSSAIRASKVQLQAELAAKRKEAEFNSDIAKQQQRLTELQEKREIEAMEAKLKVLSEADSDSESDQSFKLNPKAKSFHPKSEVSTIAESQIGSLAQVLADSLNKSRLPVPTPPIFTGDPASYINFKMSFKTLIESRQVPPNEKLYYLQLYVSGPAKAAIEGCFFGKTEEAYLQAWKTLDERFGHPFKIQQSLRERLESWPKIQYKDPKGLQKFADYLRLLSDALPHVKGLSILNDNFENRRMLTKLPDWCANRWTRFVTDRMEAGGDYPDFAAFVKFVGKEASVVNNPICSLTSLKESTSDSHTQFDKPTKSVARDKQRRPQGVTLATQRSDSDANAVKKGIRKRTCTGCHSTKHPVWSCETFESMSVEQRHKLVEDRYMCRKCLQTGHIVKDCSFRGRCKECDSDKHHTLLHKESGYTRGSTNLTVSETLVPTEKTISNKAHIAPDCNMVCSSMIVPVWVSTGTNEMSEIMTYALIDTQSDSSYISDELASKLSVPHTPVRMQISTLTSTDLVDCHRYENLSVRGLNQSTQVVIRACFTKHDIPCNRDHIPSQAKISEISHLANIAPLIPAIQDCDIGLLIGYNCPQAMAPIKTVLGGPDEPFAVQTALGWSVVGGLSVRSDDVISFCHRTVAKVVPLPTPRDILNVLDQDFSEAKLDDVSYSQEDLNFLSCLEDGIKVDGDGYITMPLPLKGDAKMPNNYSLARSRLEGLKRKLKRNDQYKNHYVKFMNEMTEKGYAMKVPPPSANTIVNYIPHHGVYHPQKPDKIRVVFDGSAKCKGVSLNDMLLKGPDLMNNLIGVLIRFRQEKYAFTCDIEKMFYNFKVDVQHRDLLRYLWWEDGDTSKPPAEYQLAVHLFGAASSPGCANYGLKFLADRFSNEFPNASKFLQRNFYVDDGLMSVATKPEAIALVEQSVNLCKQGNIRLHKFMSNDSEVLESIPQSERAPSTSTHDIEFENMERTLGIFWDAKDQFRFKVVFKGQPNTRRGVLSAVASIYDPLGFACPVILPGKQILQELCKKGISWDEPLSEQVLARWERWKTQITGLECLEIPRWYRSDDLNSDIRYELHHFSDASQSGYGQCSYLRSVDSNGKVHCSLIMAKSRVSPMKLTSIPRLELAAAVTSVKISVLIKRELELSISQEYFWTDSKVVLGYIANEARRFHIFVGNRVQYIRDRSEVDQWHYVSTHENPADIASRGMSVDELIASNWLTGPKFLWKPEISISSVESSLILGDPEVKAQCLTARSKEVKSGLLSNMENISNWRSMVRGVARIRRWISKDRSDELSLVNEYEQAENLILKWVQADSYSAELDLLGKGKPVLKNSELFKLDPKIDERGIMRISGRLGNSDAGDKRKCPIILPRNAHVTRTIIEYVHRKTQHQGRGQTVNELRTQGYWVVGGSKVVADVIRNCVICRRLRRPTETQKMANLPKERTEASPPFYYSGIDVFGPFMVKRGRSEIKRYGLLFTCLCSRAVHVELLDDLSTDAFINSLRCFLALRGTCRSIFCDQGTNFVGANNELQRAVNEMADDEVNRFLAERQCEFSFNTPHRSHAAGVWERQIRSIRNVLYSTINIAANRLDDSSLRTLFYEAAYIVNSRPLSPTDLNDPLAEPPITPNQLLHAKPHGVLPPPGVFLQDDVYARKRWRRVQYLCQQFWHKWRKEYLSGLQERHKWVNPKRNMRVGDIVLVADENVHRTVWPLGLIVETPYDKDGLVRKVTVRVSKLNEPCTKTKRFSELQRPVQKVVLLLATDSPPSSSSTDAA